MGLKKNSSPMATLKFHTKMSITAFDFRQHRRLDGLDVLFVRNSAHSFSLAVVIVSSSSG